MNSVLGDHPDLEDCAASCCHCGIRFLTHPRNARRIDLRCPFGCRQHHRKQQSNRRSTAYYQTEEGKQLKSELNQRRSMPCQLDECPPAQREPPVDSGNEALPEQPGKASVDDSGNITSVQTVKRPSPLNASLLAVTLEMQLGGVLLREADVVHCSLLAYLCAVASLLEGRTIGRDELVAALLTRMRQHSIGQLPHREYVRDYLNQHPP